MAETKQRQQAKEEIWGCQNNNADAICRGHFYIWNRGFTEKCINRDVCEKHLKYNEIDRLGETVYDKPNVNFYYVVTFRKCELYKQ